jgi:hypothetical protein
LARTVIRVNPPSRVNPVGTSTELRERTHTDDKNGRLVRVLRAGEPMAEFYVGKQPKQGYHEFFIRKADEDAVYRTTTLLERDRISPLDPGARGARLEWDAGTRSCRGSGSTRRSDPAAPRQEIRLHRRDHYDALQKEAEDKWNLLEGKEPVPADADAADGVLSVIRRLSLYEVLGKYEDVKGEYGLDAPEITLLMTLRKKDPKPPPKEGEEKKEGEEPKEDWTTFTRTVEVGKKVTRPRYDSYSDEMKSEDYYAVRVDPEHIDDPERARGLRSSSATIREPSPEGASEPREGRRRRRGPGKEEEAPRDPFGTKRSLRTKPRRDEARGREACRGDEAPRGEARGREEAGGRDGEAQGRGLQLRRR